MKNKITNAREGPGSARFSDDGGPGRGRNGPDFPAGVGGTGAKTGRPLGTPEGHITARERLYRVQAEQVELRNALRRAELLEVADVKQGWARLVLGVREAFLTLPMLAVQRGIVTREQEAALQGLVDQALQRLSAREA